MNTAIVPVSEMERIASAVANSKLFGITTVDQALSLMAIAQAEGKHPASAAKEYHIIKGRPSLKADAMLARFQQAGGTVNWIERTDSKVSGKFIHPQGGELVVTWTLEDGKRAGLAGGDNWKKYPRQMLTARVISEGVRAVYPAVVSGLYTPEEVGDFDAPAAPVARPAISKPVFSNAPQTQALPEPVVEAEVVEAPVSDLFKAMDDNHLTEEDVLAFCKSKGMKTPDYVADLPEKAKSRLLEILPEVIAFSLAK